MGDRVLVQFPVPDILFRYVTNQPAKVNSVFHPSGICKWVPASAEKAKADIVHSVSGWTRGVQVKLWNPLRTRAIPERLSRQNAIQIQVYVTLPYLIGKRVVYRDFSVNWTFFAKCYGWDATSKYRFKIGDLLQRRPVDPKFQIDFYSIWCLFYVVFWC